MLPADYRFIVYNDCTQQLDFSGNSANEKASVTIHPYYLNPSDGKIDRGSEATHSAATDLANGITEVMGTESGEELVGMHGVFHVETDNGNADGNVILGIEYSTDGGSTWPSAATNWDPDSDMQLVSIITLSGAESHSTNFEL